MTSVPGDRQALTLVDFLLARIAEDEEVARRVTWSPQASDNIRALQKADHQRANITREPRQVFAEDGRVIDWDAYNAALGPVEPITETGYASVLEDGWGEYYGDAEFYHATRWHPARVLAECAAKRRILELHSDTLDHGGGRIRHTGRCDTCKEDVWRAPDDQFPCETLKTLALPYADHPDYREEWRP